MQNIRTTSNVSFGDRAAMLGRVTRMFFEALSIPSLRSLSREDFCHYVTVLGIRAVPLIGFGSILISLAVTTHAVQEAQRFNAEDATGAVIAIGLLRELAPLTVGLAWAGRTAAFLSESAFAHQLNSEQEFAARFLTPAYLGAVVAAFPLAAFGLVLGFGAAALFAPLLGASSTADFLDAARQTVQDKDVGVYIIKLVLINPMLVVFASSLACIDNASNRASITASAVTYACILVFVFNLVCTWAWYLP